MGMASLRRRHMLIFQTVMRARSVTEAAQQLGISQPATSRALFELEEQVGFPLFNRSSGRTTPTVEARNLLPEIDELLLHHDLVEGRIRAVRARNEGTLAIAAPPGLVTSFLSRAVARYAARKRKVSIRLESHSMTRIAESVVRQEVDFGFVYSPTDLSKVRSIPICRSEIVCVFPPGHRLAQKRVVAADDLIDERIVTLTDNAMTGMLIREALRPEQMDAIIESNLSLTAPTMVSEGGVVGLMDSASLEGVFSGLEIRRFKPSIDFRIFAICSRYRPPSRTANDFLADLNKVLKELARAVPSVHLTGAALRF